MRKIVLLLFVALPLVLAQQLTPDIIYPGSEASLHFKFDNPSNYTCVVSLRFKKSPFDILPNHATLVLNPGEEDILEFRVIVPENAEFRSYWIVYEVRRTYLSRENLTIANSSRVEDMLCLTVSPPPPPFYIILLQKLLVILPLFVIVALIYLKRGEISEFIKKNTERIENIPDHFMCILFGIAGGFIIWYRFRNLGKIGILLAVNTFLLISLLSYLMVTEELGE